MLKRDLHSIINYFEKKGELIRIKEFVDPVLEITEITDRFCKSPNGGKALLFENTGTDFPVIINLFGSLNRMNYILGVNNLDQISDEINKLFQILTQPKRGFLNKIMMLPVLKKISDWMPGSISGRGECQQIIHKEPDLEILPVLKCWPFDGGSFITLPIVITKDPELKIRNVGMYRMQILGRNETAMHWQKYKTGRKHFEKYKTLNRKMPVAVALGGDPIYAYSATAPLPENIDEFLLAGFLRKNKVKLVKCITQDIEVPEDADIIIEGYIDPEEEFIWEGPFGDHTGFYSLADWFPKLHVTCITHKKEAIYPATIVGQPPMEDAWIAKATERIFLTPLKMAISPEIIDMHLPFEGVAHNIVILKIAQSFQGQGTRVMHAMWGAGQMAFNKILIIVSDEIDLTDYLSICKTISKNINIKKDIHLSEGVLDELDHASAISCYGGKICFDATNQADRLFINKEKISEWKKTIINLENSVRDINIDLIEDNIAFAIIAIQKNENISGLIENILCKSSDIGLKLLIFVESSVDIFDYSMLAWIVSANIDPQKDCIVDSDKGILTIDATRKIYKGDNFSRKWPNIVHMNKETIQKINEKWSLLGIGDLIESPSRRLMQMNKNQGDIAITD